MADGPYATLMTMLSASSYLTGVNIVFGEENINAQEFPIPFICVVPVGGSWQGNAYIKGLDPEVEKAWCSTESVELWCWNAVNTGGVLDEAATPQQHADAVVTLLTDIVSAFQDQRVGEGGDDNSGGLAFYPVSGRWEQMKQGSLRYGRAYVLTISLEVPFMMPIPVGSETTITEITIDSETIIPPG